ncbi:putative Ras- protein Rab-4A [Clonorchis sinensis]|uniref:Ras- protein Rab-4A n=2 Tax=Clonorchis sinensis TaxID=79923 RepID=A0A8T1MRX6_CLOSI|nr:putative Ras- protein Rab-4A [Clonorchis sinensis]GAA56598.1 probable Ras-related protein Rab-4A [Clonorchis sinensis]
MQPVDQFSYLFKFLIIGTAGAGKTCILRRYTERKFIGNMPHTIGAEFGSKIISVDGTAVKIQIWDTAGQERFRSMARSYYHDAVGALLVYDITNRDSFNALSHWLNDVRQLAAPEVVVILVGNKLDLQDQDGQVTHWEANAFAQDNDLHFIETSALTGENVDEAFLHCTRTILAKIKSGDLDPDRLGYGRQRNILGGVPGGDRPLPLTDTQPSVVTYHNDCSC